MDGPRAACRASHGRTLQPVSEYPSLEYCRRCPTSHPCAEASIFDSQQAISCVTAESIIAFIESAKARLVVLAPAVSLDIAMAIRERWTTLGAANVSIILDVDEEVYRLGYGDIGALDLLERTGASLRSTLQRQPGIRIGVVVADQRVLVFTPTPLLIEAGPRKADAPNAIVLNAAPRELENDLGIGAAGHKVQEVGLDKARRDDIDAVKARLERNPPRPFDVERRLRVFSAAFRFVELTMAGTQMARRTVQIPSHLISAADEETTARLRTLLTIVPPDHKLAGRPLARLRKRIADRYLHPIAGYGSVLLRGQEEAFRREVKDLETAVEAFQSTVRDELEAELQKRISELCDALVPAIAARPPLPVWGLARPWRDAAEAKDWIREDLLRAIGHAERYVGAMNVKVIFKDVTFESLNDPQFMEAARKAFPDLPELYLEEEAAPVAASSVHD